MKQVDQEAHAALARCEARLIRLGVTLSTQARIAYIDGYKTARRELSRLLTKYRHRSKNNGR